MTLIIRSILTNQLLIRPNKKYTRYPKICKRGLRDGIRREKLNKHCFTIFRFDQ